MNNKSIIAIIALIVVAIVVAVILIAPGSEEKSHIEVEVSGSVELPVVTFKGDTRSEFMYESGVDTIEKYAEWLKNNYTNGKALPLFPDMACSAFEFKNSTNNFIGRNLDFIDVGYPMVVKCIPEHGYKSIGVGPKIGVFGIEESLEDMNKDSCAAAAPFMMMDGINEKGLFCAHLVVHKATSSTTMENAMFSMPFMRYILDNAADVEEVKKIVKEKGFNAGMKLISTFTMHLFVVDGKGNSLIIECVNGELCLTEGAKILTNHYITEKGKDTPVTDSSINRYNALVEDIALMGEDTTFEDCMKSLEKVSQLYLGGGTLWSAVYETNSLTMKLCTMRDYEYVYTFSLKDIM